MLIRNLFIIVVMSVPFAARADHLFLFQDLGDVVKKATPRAEQPPRVENADPQVKSQWNLLDQLEKRTSYVNGAHDSYNYKKVKGVMDSMQNFIPDPLVEFAERSEALRIEDQSKRIAQLKEKLERRQKLDAEEMAEIGGMMVRTDLGMIVATLAGFWKFYYDQKVMERNAQGKLLTLQDYVDLQNKVVTDTLKAFRVDIKKTFLMADPVNQKLVKKDQDVLMLEFFKRITGIGKKTEDGLMHGLNEPSWPVEAVRQKTSLEAGLWMFKEMCMKVKNQNQKPLDRLMDHMNDEKSPEYEKMAPLRNFYEQYKEYENKSVEILQKL